MRLWRGSITPMRSIGAARKTPYMPDEYFGTPLSYNAFYVTDDYRRLVECPCGVEIHDWDGSIGDALRAIDDHCAAARHPQPRRDD